MALRALLRQCGPDPGIPVPNRRAARYPRVYWANRLIGALADSHHAATASAIERYQNAVAAKGRALLQEGDKADLPADGVSEALAQWNDKIASMAQEETQKALGKVLYEASNGMKNSFARSDA